MSLSFGCEEKFATVDLSSEESKTALSATNITTNENSLAKQKGYIDNANNIERVFVRWKDVFVKDSLKKGIKLVQKKDTSGASSSFVDVVQPKKPYVHSFIHFITMVMLESLNSNTVSQDDLGRSTIITLKLPQYW